MDITAPETVGQVALRLSMALIAGGFIGVDRELREKPAGVRTHAMVALGSAVMCVMALGFDGSDTVNAEVVSRVLQGLVAGIGFIGAGSIIRRQGEEDVAGLTTASSIWVVAAAGAAIGLGLYALSALTTALALVVLRGGDVIDQGIARRKRRSQMTGQAVVLPDARRKDE